MCPGAERSRPRRDGGSRRPSPRPGLWERAPQVCAHDLSFPCRRMPCFDALGVSARTWFTRVTEGRPRGMRGGNGDGRGGARPEGAGSAAPRAAMGPAAGHRLDQTFGFAVGARSKRAGPCARSSLAKVAANTFDVRAEPLSVSSLRITTPSASRRTVHPGLSGEGAV